MQHQPEEKGVWGQNAEQHGVAPAIALVNPKHSENVAKVVRLASCYGFSQVWWTGQRVGFDLEKRGRLPREERMKGYRDVTMIQHDRFFDQFPKEVTPVAVEVREGSIPLTSFEHPENPLYVFGPEDGSIPSVLMQHCHQAVVIPTRHCLNLATAVSTVMWDHLYKRWLAEDVELTTPGDFEGRGYEIPIEEEVPVCTTIDPTRRRSRR